MNSPNMNLNNGNGNIMDVIKSNLMTMMLFKSANSNTEKGGNIFDLLYVF